MSTNKIFAVLLLVCAVAAAAWAQLTVKPGEYQVAVELQLPGAPAPNTMQTLDCIAAEDAADLSKAMLRELATEDTCTSSNLQTIGNKMSFDVLCTVEGEAVKSTLVVTVTSPESYSAVMDINVEGAVISTRMTGTWVGATCSPESLEDEEQ